MSPSQGDAVSLPLRDTIDLIADLLPLAGRRIVDVGCGDGTIVRFLATRGAHAAGVEPRQDALDRATAIATVADERYVRAGGAALPLDDESMDAVLYHNSLHHVPPEQQAPALVEARRVLTSSGQLLVIEPLAKGPYFELVRPVDDETDVRAHAYDVIRQAAALGFREDREVFYQTRGLFADFAAFEARVTGVDESRKDAFARHRDALRAAFHDAAISTDDGAYAFDQPMRANLLSARERSA